MASLTLLSQTLQPVLQPLHPSFPFPLLDIYGAMRLSSVVNWMAAPKPGNKARASLLQECLGICVVLFGGETFLCMCTGQTPSWLMSPNLALLFCSIHTLLTRTPLLGLLPASPSLALETALALPDAIGRTLLLTRFTVLPLLHPSSSPSSLPATPTSLLLTPFIMAVPFPAMTFGFDAFSPSPKIQTPAELKPRGWMMVDFWAPIVIPILFLSLIGPVKGWGYGLGWSEEEGVMGCVVVLSGLFLSRAVYNFGGEVKAWRSIGKGRAGPPKGIKEKRS